MKHTRKILICLLGLCAPLCVLWSIGVLPGAPNDESQPGDKADNLDTSPPADKPMIIWFHSGGIYSLESLKTAVSSGLITHVMILYRHRADADWQKDKNVLKAIELVRESDAKLIWARNLWPYYNNRNVKLSDFFDPSYYIAEVLALRAEAKQIGADFAALDNEPYGNSLMKYYLKGRRKPTPDDRKRLAAAVRQAVSVVGQADFIMHAGAITRPSFELIAQLGRNRICEQTYWYDRERYKTIKYPYEIFGVYVNTTRTRPEKPYAPYFLVSDVFERSELWSKKKGVFLYTDRKNAPAVANALREYARNLPRIGPPGQHSSDSPPQRNTAGP